MTDQEYNLYIENYLKNDKTQSAIMLIAPWGMGKSYYIQNSLIPHLEQTSNKRCVVVSLYGLNDTKEISKAIYFETRIKDIGTSDEKNPARKVFDKIVMKSACIKKEKVQAGKIVGKTIIKGALSLAGIDLSLDDKDLEKLYSSIDLTNYLLILEDLERSSISIKQVLGFVNNLVEQDGAKVLLVANEKEIKDVKQIITKNSKGEEQSKRVYTEETEEYLAIKEKTVSDTILYLCNYDDAIESILNLYSESIIARLLEDKNANGKPLIVNEINMVMADVGDYNLRSFIFACQKTADMFSNYTGEVDNEFLMHVFLGNVAFALRVKGNDDLKWEKDVSPNKLGTSKYPLYEFCKDYFKYQEIDLDAIKSSQDAYIERKEYEQKQREMNSALSILYDFPTQKEEILALAIEMVRDELKTGDIIPLVQYGKLANYLIIVKKLLENSEIIDECKSIMLANMQKDVKKDSKVLDGLRFHDSFNFWESEQQAEYNQFTAQMSSVFQESPFSCLENEEPIVYLEKVSDLMSDREGNVRHGRKFLKSVDREKISKGLEIATAKQVSNFRRGILSIYDVVNIRDFLPEDKDALIELKEVVQKLLDDGKGEDKVIRLQYTWLLGNLKKVLENY
ncbi:MAG: hypothetical protein IJ282_07190 [Lachnospiraceae bacterium]|nr:hypothetical protein [Lachnospiraceae bacterium]